LGEEAVVVVAQTVALFFQAAVAAVQV